MSLEIETPAGIGLRAEQALHTYWSTIHDVQLALWKDGFGEMQRPLQQIPQVTAQMLSSASSHDYSTWFMGLSGWQGYISYQINWIDAKLLECVNELEQLKARTRVRMRETPREKGDKKPTDEQVKDAILTNPRYNEVVKAQQELTQRKLLIEPVYEYVKTTLKLMSRSIEGRKLEMELGARGTGARRGPE